MGFIIKSAFWLGIVYSAMPFADISTPNIQASICSSSLPAIPPSSLSVDAARRLAAAGECAAIVSAVAEGIFHDRPPLVLRASRDRSRTTQARASANSLTGLDLRTPWFGRAATHSLAKGATPS